MRLLTCTLVFVAAAALAETPRQRLDAFAEKTRAERKKLGLDKNDSKLGTPEVSFIGTPTEGVNAVLCATQPLVVKLKGVAPKSLVIPNVDDVAVSKESWSGTEWTGTLTAKKSAAPHTFGLMGVLATTGQEFSDGAYVLGCAYTLTFEVEGATLVVKVDLRQRQQDVTGEWKKGGKTLGTRAYRLSLRDDGVSLDAQPDEADVERSATAMTKVMQSSKWKDLEARQNASIQKIEACTKAGIDKLQACMKPIEAEMKKQTDERDALMAEAEKSSAPPSGCLQLWAAMPDRSYAQQCAGHRTSDEVPLKWSWTSP